MNIHKYNHPLLVYFRTKCMREFIELISINSKSLMLDVGEEEYEPRLNWNVGVSKLLDLLNQIV
jgi:hypothetical protein